MRVGFNLFVQQTGFDVIEPYCLQSAPFWRSLIKMSNNYDRCKCVKNKLYNVECYYAYVQAVKRKKEPMIRKCVSKLDCKAEKNAIICENGKLYNNEDLKIIRKEHRCCQGKLWLFSKYFWLFSKYVLRL